MKLEKILTVCSANAGRSVLAESVVQTLEYCSENHILVYGRGINANRYNLMLSAEGKIDEKFVSPTIERYRRFKTNFSQNIANMIEQNVDGKEIAKAILNEERAEYIRQIKRYCDEQGLHYPKEWHTQLDPDGEITENTMIVSLEKNVKSWIDENYSGVLRPCQFVQVDVDDVLGGDYNYRKEIWANIHAKLQDVVPEAILHLLDL